MGQRLFYAMSANNHDVFCIKHFNKTMLNNALLIVLKYLNNTNNRTILLTYSGKNRAEQLLEYHGISNLFCEKYFKEDFGKISKYKFAENVLDIDAQSIVLFENETEGCNEAINDGFVKNNIIKIV